MTPPLLHFLRDYAVCLLSAFIFYNLGRLMERTKEKPE